MSALLLTVGGPEHGRRMSTAQCDANGLVTFPCRVDGEIKNVRYRRWEILVEGDVADEVLLFEGLWSDRWGTTTNYADALRRERDAIADAAEDLLVGMGAGRFAARLSALRVKVGEVRAAA